MTDTLLKNLPNTKASINSNKNFREDYCENDTMSCNFCNSTSSALNGVIQISELDIKSEISNGKRIDLDGEDLVLNYQNKSKIYLFNFR